MHFSAEVRNCGNQRRTHECKRIYAKYYSEEGRKPILAVQDVLFVAVFTNSSLRNGYRTPYPKAPWDAATTWLCVARQTTLRCASLSNTSRSTCLCT